MYKKQKIHFVGIGGVGMSGIAEVLLNLGYPVSGSDLKQSKYTQRLKKLGARIYIGHRRSNLKEVSVVVMSTAVKSDNPELLEAHARQVPVIRRAQMLAQLMRFSKYGIAVAGTHGKTTTTSLIASMLYHGGLDPTVIIGGKVNSFRSNARLGRGEFMVAESDESDGSFLILDPAIAIITNIDREHMDYYKNFEGVKKAYLEFAKKVPFYGVVICCVDHPVVSELISQLDERLITYGTVAKADLMAKNITFHGALTTYDLYTHGVFETEVTLNLTGEHNVANSLAAIAIAKEVGITQKKWLDALKSFQGIERRCQVLLQNSDITVIDDYGHHPQEIKATIAAIRGSYAGRLVVFFQPHRYTRTKDLFSQFKSSFDGANVLVLTDIYAASEKPIPGVNAKKLVKAIHQDKKNVYYFPKNKKISDEVIKLLRKGDILLTLGAGDITKYGKECAQKLKKMELQT
ncbi:MAG: UDP-N-acetylmuramate--L-alanine ligase [Deltaproteobacteria bacterium RIFCSPLOWO2_12_FULL_40_28]|nr:MAG: UDP-N-acetylmuramate--L-alanine ligase [Deltaproteobacteria bacterium RIFCSPHIGHO2_02_FULL_40_28]OGQ19178.1 MAG: UDP-N-acetylmuramate--L-alanine ligase [Deltaproteobacteria bacterium RIFCSPHIGHO2_12_FULL_40_32]OGQ39794.1 MAG: UDP-N-acetylmuramate--L-alanine ligase [Deltaproteobacteria bacterium RIFCSPLOWO2_02_FULL_40_36]OGQ53630.1 MAG: UDP-N-acetylmuramate--L-alanine ligase [Deltaproteobacteria bacterium RIFCSPLOWO2_12_FULL_40_28]